MAQPSVGSVPPSSTSISPSSETARAAGAATMPSAAGITAAASGPDSRCSAGTTGWIIVLDQAGLDRLAGCETFHGSLQIQFDADRDLTPLEGLRVVEGQLIIVPGFTDTLQTLDVHLSSLHGLEALTHVDGLVLSNIDGGLEPLSGLSGDVGTLSLAVIPGLRDLTPLSALTITNQLSVASLEDLQSLGGGKLAPHLGSVAVSGVSLQNLKGLDDLVSLDELDLRDLPALRELSLPDSLTSLRSVLLSGVPQLTTLKELSRFERLEGLVVENAPQLADLGGGSPGASSLLSLTLHTCPSLTTVDPVGGLAGLVSVEITECDKLTEIDAVGTSAALEQLSIGSNAALARLPVFDQVKGPMRGISIYDNRALVTGARFPNLTSLYNFETLFYQSADLVIANNPKLESIGDFPQLDSVTMIEISNDAALTAISLPHLESLYWLRVKQNPSLTSLKLNLQAQLHNVELIDNPSLELLALGTPAPALEKLELHGNILLEGSDQQRLIDLTGPDTALTLEAGEPSAETSN